MRDVLTDDKVESLYREMVVARAFDDAALKLQRSGRMGTFPQNRGQEAMLGAAVALRKGHDHIVPAYRENIALFHHGLPMHLVLMHWMGDERGNAVPPGLRINPICVEIGAQVLHGAGVAWALKLQNKKRGEDRVCATFLGDGATSEGDFHEGVNFAGVLRAPAVFVCQNNGWAISVPTDKQTASETFAQKALAYGIPTVQADGSDLFAVYAAVRQMAERARRGEGAGFVETTCYRQADHTTADDARRYRPEGELEKAAAADPLLRVRRFLEKAGRWDPERQSQEEQRAQRIVREVIAAATTGLPKPSRRDIFDHVFADAAARAGPATRHRPHERPRPAPGARNPPPTPTHPRTGERLIRHSSLIIHHSSFPP